MLATEFKYLIVTMGEIRCLDNSTLSSLSSTLIGVNIAVTKWGGGGGQVTSTGGMIEVLLALLSALPSTISLMGTKKITFIKYFNNLRP